MSVIGCEPVGRLGSYRPLSGKVPSQDIREGFAAAPGSDDGKDEREGGRRLTVNLLRLVILDGWKQCDRPCKGAKKKAKEKPESSTSSSRFRDSNRYYSAEYSKEYCVGYEQHDPCSF